MMVKNLSMDQFFWINAHVNSLLELTFTLTRLFWHLLTLTCSICAMLAEWSEQLWTSQTLLLLHAVAWFLSIVWPPSESQLVAFCSWWRKWNTCTCILQRFNVRYTFHLLIGKIVRPIHTNELQWVLNSWYYYYEPKSWRVCMLHWRKHTIDIKTICYVTNLSFLINT